MAALSSRRLRPNVRYNSEQSLRVNRGQYDGHFDDLAMQFCGRRSVRGLLAGELERIAEDFEHSRRLRSQTCSRPDLSCTLDDIRSIAERVNAGIANLSDRQVEAIEEQFDQSLFARSELPVQRCGTLLLELSDVIGATSRISRADPVAHAMAEFGTSVREAGCKLACSPMKAEWEIAILCPRSVVSPSAEEIGPSLQRFQRLLEAVRDAAAMAYKFRKPERGPCKDNARDRCVTALAEVYKIATGSEPTHTAHSGRQYIGVLNSGFGKLVSEFMKIAEPDDQARRGLAESVAAVCWPSRAA